MRVEELFTLSSYEQKKYEIGHVVDGKTPKFPSFAETLSPLDRMINAFKDYPTGSKIRVTMEAVEE